VIPFLWQQLLELWGWLRINYHPVWDTLDILAVTLALYGLLLLIRGTRAVQMMVGLLVLIAARLLSDVFQLSAMGLILQNFFNWGWLIIIILFQNDIRRALARMGGGFFPSVTPREATQMLEEIVRAAQTLAQKRVGALIVLERETNLEDLVEAGVALDAAVTKELLVSTFLPYSPLHDGAVLVKEGRLSHAGCVLPLTLRSNLPEGVGTRHRAAVGITEESDAVVVKEGRPSHAGCVLPLTLRSNLPEGVGTRHRAAVGITEESDAVVVVVSEETAAISVVVGGEMTRDLDAPRLRKVLRDLLAGDREAREVVEEVDGEAGRPALRSVGGDG